MMAVMEIGGNFSYQKQYYGEHDENNQVTRSYSFVLAQYFFTYTGIEFNYSKEQEITTVNTAYDLYPGVRFVNRQDRQQTDVYGVGIRQMLGAQNWPILPVISIGYAKQFKGEESDIYYDVSGSELFIHLKKDKERNDAVFGKFTLKIKLTRTITLTGGVKTVFKAFEWNDAKKDVRYNGGISILL